MRVRLCACVMQTILMLSLPAQATTPAPVRSVILKQVTRPTPEPAWFANLCAQLPQPCSAEYFSIYKPARPIREAGFFIIDSMHPALIGIRDIAGDKAEVMFRYDFSAYSHSFAPNEEAQPAKPLTLFPALYPVRQGQWAVALIRKRQEAYAGGGASFDVADFLRLGPEPATPDVLYAGVPFSCTKMVRACFVEADYRKSQHCHDESTGGLSIQYRTLGNRPDYAWNFLWHEQDWPAKTAPSGARHTEHRFSLPNGPRTSSSSLLPAEVPFCNGGPGR